MSESQEFKQTVSEHIRGVSDSATTRKAVPTDYLSAVSDLKLTVMSYESFSCATGAAAACDAEYYRARIQAYKIVWKRKFVQLMNDVNISLGRASAKAQPSTKKIFVVNRGTFKKYCKEHNFDPKEIDKDDAVGQAITHILTYRPIDPETKKLMTVYQYLIRNGTAEHVAGRYVRDSMKVSRQTQAIVAAQKSAEKTGALRGAY